jgi:DNA-binding Lrp family transcriptional regulator
LLRGSDDPQVGNSFNHVTKTGMKKKQINLQDITIQNIIAEHAELNNKQLSERIGLSEGPSLVRVQRLWERGIVKSHEAIIYFPYFGYTRYFCIRAEISATEAPKMKMRFLLNRYIIFIIEFEVIADVNIRIYLAACLTKNLKTAKKVLQSLMEGFKELVP